MIVVDKNVQLNLGGYAEELDDDSCQFFARQGANGTIINIGHSNVESLVGTLPDTIIGKNMQDFFDPQSAKIISKEDKFFRDSERNYATATCKVKFAAVDHEVAPLVARFRLFDTSLGEETILVGAAELEPEEN